MLDISIKNALCEISEDSHHSYDVLEEYTLFILALNQSIREKNAETLRVVVRSHFVFSTDSHVLPVSGGHFPSTWKFLLDTVKRAKGPEVVQEILEEVEQNETLCGVSHK